MPTITQIEYALAVYELRHFGKAAKRCHVSQPTLSMQLQKLEHEIGTVLFDRSKMPVRSTQKGEQILQQMRSVVHELKKLQTIWESKADVLAGIIELAVIPTVAPYLLPRFVKSFCEKYSRISLRIREMQTNDLLSALENESIDCGILATPAGGKGFFEEPLYVEPFFVYLHKDHPLGRKAKLTETDLRIEELWLLEEGHCLRTQVTQLCKKTQSSKAHNEQLSFSGGSLETLKALVDNGYGYTLVPQLSITPLDELKNDIELKRFKSPEPAREISLIFLRDELKRPLLEVLAKEIRAQVPQTLLKNKGARILPI